MYPVEMAYLEKPTENYITAAVTTVMEIHLTVGIFIRSLHDFACHLYHFVADITLSVISNRAAIFWCS
jgi:hypothetical protein